jgi:Flp pilus assembly protein TadG
MESNMATGSFVEKLRKGLQKFRTAEGGNVMFMFAAARRLRRNAKGSVAMTFGIALVPITIAVGTAVDYSRASSFKTVLQSVLDTALLAGAKDGSSSWSQQALSVFQANLAVKSSASLTPTFTLQGGDTYLGSVTASVPTVILGIIKIPSMNVAANATVKSTPGDNACILTLDKGQPTSHVSLKLNGAPIIDLTGCTVRSNTSLDCNGHDGNITISIASGTATSCGKPQSYAPVVPDIYADLAKNITPKCGSLKTGINWTPGSIPTGAAIKTVNMGGYTEYHICGDLNLSGTGYLTGSAPASDTIIVIENGSLNIADKASINTLKTAIVMTGNNTVASSVNFPNGNGKSATLSLSPPTDAANPWQGVALYQDPKLTFQVDDTWGPGANFNADGLVYLGNSNVVTDGNTSSSNAKCTKFVINSFTTNGKIDLSMSQSSKSCGGIGLKQWGGITVHLTQ